MGLTIAKWEEHFKDLDQSHLENLLNSVEVLESDPVFKEQYGWTGLFALKYSLLLVLDAKYPIKTSTTMSRLMQRESA
jgi:hypothetical protein